MMNNNKILTVSYGTFSCTLEGFDDSFDTMKAIAEYFRDLASDDRYFGAEPPQPDAEMLARIAEREVARRVEAREHEGRIMLKARDAEAAQTPPADPAPETSAPAATADDTPAPVAREPAPEPEEPAAPVAFADDAIVDENITVSPGAVEHTEAAATEAAGPEADTYLEEVAARKATTEDIAERFEEVAKADEQAGAELQDVATVADEDGEAKEETSDVDPDVFAFFSETAGTQTQSYDAEETISAADFTGSISPSVGAESVVAVEQSAGFPYGKEETPENESFADKLARIRAVVSQSENDTATSHYEEDTETAREIVHFDDLDAVFKDKAVDDTARAEADVVAQAAEDINDAFELDEAASEVSGLDTLSDSVGGDDDIDNILRRIEEAAEDRDAASDNLFGETTADAGDREDDGVQGRVLKVDRSELEAALASGDLETYEDKNLSANAFLSDDDQSELARDRNALKNADTAETAHTPQRQSLPAIDEEAAEDVSRLMAEADQQMQEPEGRTRRSAFAHLRAAVAARFADRSMDDDEKRDEAEAEAYRSDLAEVVRPRRPEAGDTRTGRPTVEKATPLTLVAEQRIDGEKNTMRGPVSPRRITASADNFVGGDAAADSGFAEYASERGAQELPELLEAAAAYLSYVEGHEQFSRPELMSRVRQADCGEFSREDGLRSFGKLLRAGKIKKIEGGRFTASEGIGYKPGHRAVG
ncbi:MAG: hypothetical protein V2I76_07500 [Roseobacter sp.]|jgi:hypothetical protein|nr:hypothetical protein [Roseobacter sp.]